MYNSSLSTTLQSAGSGASFEIVPAAYLVNENSSLGFTINTTGIVTGTTLYWTINNIGTTNADFSSVSGSFTITNGVGTFTISTVADATTEGTESFTISLRRTSISGPVQATSEIILLIDTSLDPTYSLTTAPSSIDEGNTGNFILTTTDVSNGTTLYWTINQGTTVAEDFTAVSGSFTITGNSGSFSITTLADRVTEGLQNFTVSVRKTSISGTVVAGSDQIVINDTSQDPTYFVTPQSTSVNEGASLTMTVNTTSVLDGTTLYWTILNGTTASEDFTSTSGSFIITSSTGSFSVSTTDDFLTEGSENFQVEIRTTSIAGTVVVTSELITVLDSSLSPVVAFTTTPTSVNEGSSATFSISITNFGGGVLYWTVNHITTVSADFSASSGSFAIASGVGSFSVPTVADVTTEGAQTFTVSVRTASISGTVQATSSSVTINDTSITPQGQVTNISTGSVNWTCPAGVFSVSVVCIAGGGGGAGVPFSQAACGAGGGGQTSFNTVSVTPGVIYKLYVQQTGSGTSGGIAAYGTRTTGAPNGGTGGEAMFGTTNILGSSLVSAAGGRGGRGQSTETAPPYSPTAFSGGFGGGQQAIFGVGVGITGTGGRGGGSGASYGTGGGGAGGYGPGNGAGSNGMSGGAGGGAGAGAGGLNGAAKTPQTLLLGDNGGGVSMFGTSPGGGAELFGGGGGSGYNSTNGRNGMDGAVRVIWGSNRSYPATGIANV